MAYDFQVVIDSTNPHELADWWAEAFGWDVEPSDEDFIRDMVRQGFATEEETTTHRGTLVWRVGAAILGPESATGERRRILFQLVPEPKTVKNRAHLDMRVGQDRIDGELRRLLDSGARLLHHGRQGPHHRWVTIADPEGNELCLT
ncbi:VOC family protein [Actinoalloteichus caeruleus]|uniref:VOC family protein n=1 Tax=Actinoalloteichus cyanogriseus TaxID=2893586 RepID=UPI0004AACBAE|nr:VOC family protein [Actinoalloteichus caeruleus]